MNEKKIKLDHDTIAAWALAAIIVAAYVYFDIGTRWKLSETWECRQTNNGVQTVEQFGFFGSQSSFAAGGTYSGLQMFSSYSLAGNKLTVTLKSLKRADGEVKELDDIQQASIDLNINSITSELLSYRVNAMDKSADVQCQKRN
jgi:hypothetical protein